MLEKMLNYYPAARKIQNCDRVDFVTRWYKGSFIYCYYCCCCCCCNICRLLVLSGLSRMGKVSINGHDVRYLSWRTIVSMTTTTATIPSISSPRCQPQTLRRLPNRLQLHPLNITVYRIQCMTAISPTLDKMLRLQEYCSLVGGMYLFCKIHTWETYGTIAGTGCTQAVPLCMVFVSENAGRYSM